MKKLMQVVFLCATWASLLMLQRYYNSTFGPLEGGPLVRSLVLNYSYSFAVVLALSLQTYIVADWTTSIAPSVISAFHSGSMPQALGRLFVVFGAERYLLGLIESGFDIVAVAVMGSMGGLGVLVLPYTAIVWLGFLVIQAVVFLWGTAVIFTNLSDGLLVAMRNLSRSVEAIFLGMLVLAGIPTVWAWTSSSDPAARAATLASVFSAFRLSSLTQFPLPDNWFPWIATVPMRLETLEFLTIVLIYVARTYLGLRLLSATMPQRFGANDISSQQQNPEGFRLTVVRVLYFTAGVTLGLQRILFWDLRLGQAKESMPLDLLGALIPFGSNTVILLGGRSLNHLAVFTVAWIVVFALLEAIHSRLRASPAPSLFVSVFNSILILLGITCVCDLLVFGAPISLLKASRALFGS